jgi:outer membrane lipoprotein
MKIYTPILLLAFFTSGCATTPSFDTSGVNLKLTPSLASKESSNDIGQKVIWGGMILSSVNLADTTQIEVLAYPLDDDDYLPNPNAKPLGRFLLRQAGYLETKEYEEGRYVTVQGRISEIQQGRIGEKDYPYPVVESEQLFLWPKDLQDNQPKVHFGIGVMISN